MQTGPKGDMNLAGPPRKCSHLRGRKKTPVNQSIDRSFAYSERESNPHDHCWSQDFKSGVSTYSTIRAAVFGKRRDKSNKNLLIYNVPSIYAMILSVSPGGVQKISGSRRNQVSCRLA